MKKRLTGAAVLTSMVGLTACGPTMSSFPLPGTSVSGSHTTVTMDFADALNLAQGAPVKVNGVDEGKVTGIKVQNFHAEANVEIKSDAHLRQGLTARLRYTTPLGELYVDVTNPSSGADIEDGAHIPMTEANGKVVTSTAPTVEDALSQASLLINGGGIGSLQTISTELTKAFGGKSATWRDLLNRLNTVVTQANGTTKNIDAALNALNGVSVTLGKRKAVIDRALKEIGPAARVLKAQTPNLTTLLVALQKFSTQANSTLQATHADLLTTLGEVQPVLAELNSNAAVWNTSLGSIVQLGKTVQRVLPGDYLNIGGNLAINGQLLQPTSGGGAGGGTGGGTGGVGGIVGGLTGTVGSITQALTGGSASGSTITNFVNGILSGGL